MTLYLPKAIKYREKFLVKFMQQMLNRMAFGQYLYGEPNKEQNYMTRMIMEMKSYKRSGNAEQLLNIANYCWLEFVAPENKKFHHDPSVESVTRGKF
jgi:hypothetical protein